MPKSAFRAMLILIGIASSSVIAVALNYRPPNLNADLFEGPLRLGSQERSKAAFDLATIVQTRIITGKYPDHRTPRVLGLALLLDPHNVDALALDSALRQSKPVPNPAGRSEADAMHALLDRAAFEAKMKSAPDRLLAAYLYSALLYAFPRDPTATSGLADLKSEDVAVSWSKIDPSFEAQSATPPLPTSAPSPTQVLPPVVRQTPPTPAPTPVTNKLHTHDSDARPPVSEIRGLVVIEAGDHRWHGQALDIIASNEPETNGQVDIRIGDVGQEMYIAFSEAVRLVKVLHPQLQNVNMLVSFGDKYIEKDGGSAGTAFALVMLAGVGDFRIDPNVAVTGDITVDSKVRAVGEVPAKVHGVALDHCTRVCIPQDNVADMDDAYLIQGASALWETDLFSMRKFDDAIALVRADPSPNLSEAIRLFDQVKTDYANRPISDLSRAKPTLQKIAELAPNFVNVNFWLKVIDGKAPTHLSPVATVTQAVLACGPMSDAIDQNNDVNEASASESDHDHAEAALKSVESIADVPTLPVVKALESYCDAYADWAKAKRAVHHTRSSTHEIEQRKEDLDHRKQEVADAIKRVAVDPTVIDRELHP